MPSPFLPLCCVSFSCFELTLRPEVMSWFRDFYFWLLTQIVTSLVNQACVLGFTSSPWDWCNWFFFFFLRNTLLICLTLLRCNLHTINRACLKCTVWWVLTNIFIHVIITPVEKEHIHYSKNFPRAFLRSFLSIPIPEDLGYFKCKCVWWFIFDVYIFILSRLII